MRVEDILSDLDLLTIDRQAFTHFGSYATVADKRRLAVGWLGAEVKARGLDPNKHVTRRAAEYLTGLTGATETDYRDRLTDRQTEDPVDLRDVFVTPADDVLVVGHVAPFKAVTVTMLDDVNAHTLSVASLTYWNGHHWHSLGANSLLDTTRITTNSTSFSGGGAFRFVPPDDWTQRPGANFTDPWLYAVRLQMSARPTAETLVYQLLPTRQSRLTLAAGLYALHLLSIEAAKGSRADWDERAEMYAKKAYTALDRDFPLAADEFDIDNTGTGGEPSSVVPNPSLYTIERG